MPPQPGQPLKISKAFVQHLGDTLLMMQDASQHYVDFLKTEKLDVLANDIKDSRLNPAKEITCPSIEDLRHLYKAINALNTVSRYSHIPEDFHSRVKLAKSALEILDLAKTRIDDIGERTFDEWEKIDVSLGNLTKDHKKTLLAIAEGVLKTLPRSSERLLLQEKALSYRQGKDFSKRR